MSENDDIEVTGAPVDDTNQAETRKSFTQDDVDKIVRERLQREQSRWQKKFGDIDVDRYRQLIEKDESERLEQQKQRGEFEKILQETVGKKDKQLQELQNRLTQLTVDGNLLNAANAKRAINAQQVSALLRNQVRLGDSGEAEVLDSNGNVRYTDAGTAMTIDQLVDDFLRANPHFVSAGPSGSGVTGNVGDSGRKGLGNMDPSQLNMNNREDRKIYQELMRKKGIRI